jgi:cytochrome c-type biogenesis protein CcmH/NrfG
MILAILVAVSALITLLLVFRPVLQESYRSLRRVREWRAQHRLLDEAYSSGTLGAGECASRGAALGEDLLGILRVEPAPIRPTPSIWVSAIVLVLLASSAAYQWLGPQRTSIAPDSTANGGPMPEHGTDMQTVIGNLAAKLREHPDDAEGWALLGRTYKATEHYAEARDAFRHALEAAPGNADLKREYAAVAVPPPDAGSAPDALSDAEVKDAAETNAVATPGFISVANALQQPTPAHIVVNVALDPRFKDSIGPNDTLFVFAKAASGPQMPLAIARLTAAQLPASVTLTDAMGMVPGLDLSQFPNVVVGARISKSGNATAQRGDLQTLNVAATTAQVESVHLVITDRVN